jgi:hypothetical protein
MGPARAASTSWARRSIRLMRDLWYFDAADGLIGTDARQSAKTRDLIGRAFPVYTGSTVKGAKPADLSVI